MVNLLFTLFSCLLCRKLPLLFNGDIFFFTLLKYVIAVLYFFFPVFFSMFLLPSICSLSFCCTSMAVHLRFLLLRASPKRNSILKFPKLYIWSLKVFYTKSKTLNSTSKLFVFYNMVLIFVITNLNS